jgi:hypothetical protein
MDTGQHEEANGTLDHRRSIDTHAVERYLLGELTAVEAEAFELHYFECPRCALAVESGRTFVSDLIRSGTSTVRYMGPNRGHLGASLAAFRRQPAFGFAIAAALALVALYQGAIVIPGLKGTEDTVRPVTAVLMMSAPRGEPTVLPIAPGSRSAVVQMILRPGRTFTEYVCVITRGGEEVSRTPVDAPPDGEPITLEIPSAKLAVGTHELTVFGRAADGGLSDKVSSYPFTVPYK